MEYTKQRRFLARVGLVSLILWPVAIIGFLVYMHNLMVLLV